MPRRREPGVRPLPFLSSRDLIVSQGIERFVADRMPLGQDCDADSKSVQAIGMGIGAGGRHNTCTHLVLGLASPIAIDERGAGPGLPREDDMMRVWPGNPPLPRSDLGRRRGDFCPLFRERDQGRALPL